MGFFSGESKFLYTNPLIKIGLSFFGWRTFPLHYEVHCDSGNKNHQNNSQPIHWVFEEIKIYDSHFVMLLLSAVAE